MMSRKQKVANQVTEWIQDHFQKRECVKILPISKDSEKCGCGRYFANHYYFEEEQESSALTGQHRWTVAECTASFCTDTFGTLRFQGVIKPYKSMYIRLDHTVDPGDIWQLLVHVWGLEPPKLVITVCGGGNDFDLDLTSWQEFKNGLHKVVNTTSTWIITSGIRSGVVKHIASAIAEFTPYRRKKNFTVIGISPWGLIKRADRLIGQNKCLSYYPFLLKRSRFVSLSEGHDCFLLVDNGTFGRSGAELIVRRSFENFLTVKTIDSNGNRLMPVVCLMLGGGRLAIQSTWNYIQSKPPIPIVVCKNSGRAADVLAFAIEHQSVLNEREESFKSELLEKLKDVVDADGEEVLKWFGLVKECASQSKLVSCLFSASEKCTSMIMFYVTIFNGFSSNGNAEEQLDCKILNALLQGRSSSNLDRLILLLMWNREDLVRNMLERGCDGWEDNALDCAMMQALMHNQVEFVQLLLNNGIAMDAFLTPERLEELYNTNKGPENTLSILVLDVVTKDVDKKRKFCLPVIGLIIEKLMGSGYRATYRRRQFRIRYKQCISAYLNKEQMMMGAEAWQRPPVGRSSQARVGAYFFQNPFDDLFIWAVLTNRFEMALLMWQQGDEPLAKALIGFKLFKAMAKEAKEDALELEICDRLKSFSKEFGKLANELLNQCYETNEFLTMQLLTYELKNWGKKNCISLAAMANNKAFIAHRSCQLLLADLWQGGLRIRKSVNMKVLFGILLPPVIFTLPFKTKEELMLQAQTAAEHQEHCDVAQLSDESEPSSSESGNELPIKDEVRIEARTSTHHKRRERKSSPYTQSETATSSPMDTCKLKSSSSHINTYMHCMDMDNVNFEMANDVALVNVMLSSPKLFSLQMARINRQHLSVVKKIREFYRAPIAAFWSWTISYMIFLTCFTYVVLVKATAEPLWIEYYILSFVVAFFADLIRKCLVNDARGLRDKIKLFNSHPWDRTSVWACIFFFVGFGLRVNANTMNLGRIIQKVDVMYWYMRLLHVLTVSSKLGPYITIYGKMVSKMVLLCTILFVLLISFGVFRQAVTFPDEEWSWMLIRDIVYKPYFMLYGEVYAAEIDTCGDENLNCVYFHWLVPIFMTIYLLLSIIVFLNMMIAAFNYVFVNISAHSNLIWKYQKYEQVMDYEQQSFLPPPFVLLSHLCLLVGHLCRHLRWRRRFRHPDPSLKLFLSESDVAKLHDFENQCLEELMERRRAEQQVTGTNKIKDLTDRMNQLYFQMKRIQESFNEALLRINGLEKEANLRPCLSSSSSSGRPLMASAPSLSFTERGVVITDGLSPNTSLSYSRNSSTVSMDSSIGTTGNRGREQSSQKLIGKRFLARNTLAMTVNRKNNPNRNNGGEQFSEDDTAV